MYVLYVLTHETLYTDFVRSFYYLYSAINIILGALLTVSVLKIMVACTLNIFQPKSLIVFDFVRTKCPIKIIKGTYFCSDNIFLASFSGTALCVCVLLLLFML